MTRGNPDSGLTRYWRKNKSFVLVILQLGVFVLGFVWLVGLHVFVLGQIEQLDRTYLNEQSRLMLAERIKLNLVAIESKFYEIATSTSKRLQVAIKRDAVAKIRDTRELLRILEKGGTYQREVDVNLEFEESVSNPVTYAGQPGQLGYVLEIIDLMPKLAEIEKRLDELVVLTAARDDYRASKLQQPYVEVIGKIETYLKQVPPLFTRMRENTDRIHAESILKFKEFDQLTEDRKQRYRIVEMSVAVGTTFLVVLFGLVIARRVQRANAELQSANELSEMLKNEAEEAGRQNAAINKILEIATQDLPLEQTLESALEKLMSVPWLKIESQGSIFLVDKGREHLVLAAHYRLAPELQEKCASLAFGECLCGRVAKTGDVVFASCIDERHEITFSGIRPHGHFCLPIKSPERLLGVLNLYVANACERSLINENFLQAVTRTLAAVIERKQAEDMLRKLSHAVEQSPATVVITDLDGNIEYVNPMFTEKTGYRFEEAIGKNPRILKSGHTPDDVYRDLWRRMKEGRTWRGEFLTRKKNGETFWELAAISPIRTKSGAISHFMAVKEDVTKRKRIENELREATEAANQANQAKSSFLATMSHEIRTPMNGVVGMTGLLLDTELNAEQRRFAETIRESGEALLTIVNDILDFSKLEAGHLDLEETAFDLETPVAGVLEIVAPRAHAKNVEVGYFLAPDVHAVYRGDPGRLRQILMNLVGNAVKFTEAGSISIDVSRVGGDDACPLLRFEVSDTGIGIPEEALAKLFQRFSQVDASTSRRYGGTGLGLAICKRLVEAMGGAIGIDSEVGKGSTFWFEMSLPLVRQASRDSDADNSLMRGKRVLVVDDNIVNREIFLRALAAWDVATEAASDVTSAVTAVDEAAARGEPFDLVLLDYQLPDESGTDFLRALRAAPAVRTLPVIVASSAPIDEWQDSTDLALAAAYLRKPIRQSTLHETMLDVLGIGTPRAVVAVQPLDEANGSQAAMAPSVSSLRILVAEDNPVNQMVAKMLLGKLGHRVDVVGNGIEAVEAVRTLPYDLVFMDIQMPEMDGLEATQAIRALEDRKSTIPIVAMTANALKSDEERCLDAGMNGFILKPIEKDKLIALIASKFPAADSS